MIVDALRPLWLPGLSVLSGPVRGSIGEWVANGQYYFAAPVGPDRANLVLPPGGDLVSIFGAEISKFSSAAIETALQTEQFPDYPKSLAWLLIRSYYAAFFAAHAILRITGSSCTDFGPLQRQGIDALSDALGLQAAQMTGGLYKCTFNVAGMRLDCVRIITGRGDHDRLWRTFHSVLIQFTDSILASSALPPEDVAAAAGKLEELRIILTSHGHPGGNWLSAVRNKVNYSHQYHAWYPYGTDRRYCDRLFRVHAYWKNSPDNIILVVGDELTRFLTGCIFIVSLCSAMVSDMASRSVAKSFLDLGPVRLLRTAA